MFCPAVTSHEGAILIGWFRCIDYLRCGHELLLLTAGLEKKQTEVGHSHFTTLDI